MEKDKGKTICSDAEGSSFDGSDCDDFDDFGYEPEIGDSDSDDPEYLAELENVMASNENPSAQGESSSSARPHATTQEGGSVNNQHQQAVPTTGNDSDGYQTEELGSLHGSDEDEERAPPEFNADAPFGQVQLEVSMTFTTMNEFKEAVKDYNISLGKIVKFKKNEKLRCRAKCVAAGCKWDIYCSWAEPLGSFQIKTYYSTHKCCRVLKNKLADRKWVGKKLVELMRIKPDMVATDVEKFMADKFQVYLSHMKIYRSMTIARKLVEGSEKDQYALLRDYLDELHRSNPDSTVGVEVNRVDENSPARFEKLYICFDACKRGVLNSCRPLIGLDGCFLKGYYGGTILAAVTQDGNSSFYVIAFAVVEQETKETWTWFLSKLFGDIGTPTEHGWEFISDMQKGMLPAMQELCPGTRHRYCVKHLEANVWKQWKSRELRLKLWSCAKSRTMPEFQKNFLELKHISDPAWTYLQRFPPATWSRAGFSCASKNPSLLNNMCEQFNAAIVKFGGESIITMLEHIRTYLMIKMNTSRKKIQSYPGPITPAAQSKIEISKKDSHSWLPMWAGDHFGALFQVQHNTRAEKFVVDLKEMTCSCNEWDLFGIPCAHAVACIGHNGLHPENFVSSFYKKETWDLTYKPFIKPVNGQDQWKKSDLVLIHPPHYGKGGGRPKKKRNKANDVPQNPFKAKRVQRASRCGKCGNTGHNSRACKGTVQKKNKGNSSRQDVHGHDSQTSRQTTGPTRQNWDSSTSRPEPQPVFIPTPSHNPQMQIPWTYGFGVSPSRTQFLANVSNSHMLAAATSVPAARVPPMSSPASSHSIPAAATSVPAVRLPPRRPLTPSLLMPTTATSVPAVRLPPMRSEASSILMQSQNWSHPSFVPPRASLQGSAASRVRGQSFTSRGHQCVTKETLIRASKVTRSMAAKLNIPTQESTSISFQKPTTKSPAKK